MLFGRIQSLIRFLEQRGELPYRSIAEDRTDADSSGDTCLVEGDGARQALPNLFQLFGQAFEGAVREVNGEIIWNARAGSRSPAWREQCALCRRVPG